VDTFSDDFHQAYQNLTIDLEDLAMEDEVIEYLLTEYNIKSD
jgi:hypothetical protein